MKILSDNFVKCIPIVAATLEEAEADLNSALKLNPDFIEFRYDAFREPENLESLLELLNNVTNNSGIIFTYRAREEGGNRETDNEDRLNVITKVIEKKASNAIDIETISDVDFIEKIKKVLENSDNQLILSYHNFEEIPEEKAIKKAVNKALNYGDIVKLAFMVNNKDSLKNLEILGQEFRIENSKIPLILIGMGEEGKETRILPEKYNSNLTFLSDKKSSAPGQVAYEEFDSLRKNLLNEEI